jgi:hypothetical protein
MSKGLFSRNMFFSLLLGSLTVISLRAMADDAPPSHRPPPRPGLYQEVPDFKCMHAIHSNDQQSDQGLSFIEIEMIGSCQGRVVLMCSQGNCIGSDDANHTLLLTPLDDRTYTFSVDQTTFAFRRI